MFVSPCRDLRTVLVEPPPSHQTMALSDSMLMALPWRHSRSHSQSSVGVTVCISSFVLGKESLTRFPGQPGRMRTHGMSGIGVFQFFPPQIPKAVGRARRGPVVFRCFLPTLFGFFGSARTTGDGFCFFSVFLVGCSGGANERQHGGGWSGPGLLSQPRFVRTEFRAMIRGL